MFEDINKHIPTNPKKLKALKAEWRKLLMPEIKKLAKDISPFKHSKAKPLFGAHKSKYNEEQISIYGMHPNVSEDPKYYPVLPKEGFYTGTPTRVPISGIRHDLVNHGGGIEYGFFRTIKKHQEHLDSLNKPIFGEHAKDITDFFMYRGRVYGIYDVLERIYYPVYSERSLAELVKDYPELEDIIKTTFFEALKRIS